MAWENLAMKTTKFFLGLLSSLFLFVGFAKAAELTNPLQAQLRETSQLLGEMTGFCGTGPCNWADSDR